MKTEIRFIKITDVKPAPFNPSIRTDERSLRSLYASMREKGFLPHHPIILVSGNVIADGHRRWTCAKMLNITEIPYIMADETLDQVWAENGSQRAVSDKEMMMAMRDGLTETPDGKGGRIEKVINALGQSGIKLLADNNLSPRTVDTAQRIARYCGRKDDNAFVRQVVDWLIEYKCQNEVAFLMRKDIPPSVLEEKVNRREKLKMWDEE